jgi:hypothetical protein
MTGMDVKQAVTLAKQYVVDVFDGEPITNLGLEEVEFDDHTGVWSVTIGFSQSWEGTAISVLIPRARDYKIVRISDSEAKVLSVKNRALVS